MLKVIKENVSKRSSIILYSDRLNMPLMHGWKDHLIMRVAYVRISKDFRPDGWRNALTLMNYIQYFTRLLSFR